MTKQISIIGAGAIGAKHAAAVKDCNAVVAHIVDKEVSRAETLATKYDAMAAADPDTIWQDPEVDAVVIGVPNCFHKDLAIAALESGKHVLLEKPMAMNTAECEEINRAAESTQKMLQIGFVHRYTAVGKKTRELVSSGVLGGVYHVKAHLNLPRGVPGLGKWFTTKSISGGGALIDVGVHLIDLSLFVLGHPVVSEVTGQVFAKFGNKMREYHFENMWAGPPDYEGICDVEDSAHGFIRFETGTTLDLQVAWAGNFSQQTPHSMMAFFGDEGAIRFEFYGDEIIHSHEVDEKLVDEQVAVPQNDFHREQIADFLKAIDSGEVGGATGRQGQLVQSIVDRIYESST